jgi:hypothetical protein
VRDIFSIYNCGTSHNRQNLEETVADLARRTVGTENRDWMINEGPGSFSKGVKESASAYERGLAAQAKTPGTRDPVTGMKAESWFALPRGMITGYGWEHNVDHTIAVLKATIDLPRVINMAGWSRGAITCFMTAHALYDDPRTRPIDVHIFAFDPVPGPGNFDDPDKVTLPPNVKHYAAVVQQDERRKIMRPAVISADEVPGVKAKFYYMPGSHTTPVFRTKNEVGLIAAFLCHKFLQKHGTKLNNPITLSTKDLCELYAKIRIDIAEYHARQGGILQFLGRQKRQVPNNFQDSEYFVNQHHAQQFQKTFPQIWSALNTGVNPTSRTSFDNAVSVLRSVAPTTYLSLQKVGILA